MQGNQKPKISIIIPVYNLSRYIGQAIIDIKSQTFRDFEVIIINDGSTDNSIIEIERNISDDKRFILIKQDHKGAAAARNTGLRKACGETLLFLDGDDHFYPNMLEKIYARYEQTLADIVIFGWRAARGNYVYSFDSQLVNSDVFAAKDCAIKLFQIVSPASWTKLFKRSFVIDNNVKFQEEVKVCNDVYFNGILLSLAKKITVIEEVLLEYDNQRNERLSNYNSRTVKDVITAHIALKHKLIDLGLLALYEQSFNNKFVEACEYALKRVDNDGQLIFVNALKETFVTDLILDDYSEDYFFDKRLFLFYHYIKNSHSPLKRIGVSKIEKIKPAFAENNILVVFAANAYHFPYLAVTIQSIIDHATTNHNYDICVLYHQHYFYEVQRFPLQEFTRQNISVRFVPIDEDMVDAAFYNTVSRYLSVETYFRLFIPKLFSAYKRALYLDTDILVLADIADLYYFNMSDKPLAGAMPASYLVPYNDELVQHIKNDLSLPNDDNYINAGVMLFDIDKLIADDFFNRCRETLAKLKYPTFHDQDTINTAYYGRIAVFGEEWNVHMYMFERNQQEYCAKQIGKWEKYEKYLHHAKILHYTGAKKPWSYPEEYGASYWWQCARETSFYEVFLSRLRFVRSDGKKVADNDLLELSLAFNTFMAKISFGKKRRFYYEKVWYLRQALKLPEEVGLRQRLINWVKNFVSVKYSLLKRFLSR
ncbi:glycosyltransferase [bacterium]|nr:glycosyltransferase [bacterium]